MRRLMIAEIIDDGEMRSLLVAGGAGRVHAHRLLTSKQACMRHAPIDPPVAVINHSCTAVACTVVLEEPVDIRSE
jgi:hypothetical protein